MSNIQVTYICACALMTAPDEATANIGLWLLIANTVVWGVLQLGLGII